MSPTHRDVGAATAQTVDCRDCGLRALCFPGRVSTQQLGPGAALRIRRRRVAAGTWLYRPGDPVRSLFTLRSGCAKEVAVPAADNAAELVLNFFLPGETMGHQYAGAERHHSGVLTVQACCYCEVSWTAFRSVCEQSAGISHELLKLVARAVLVSQDMLSLSRGRDALTQVAAFLVNVSARLHQRGMQAADFRLGMSRHDIANYLGLTAETISRCLSELARRGVISVRAKRVQLLKPSVLHHLAPPSVSRLQVRTLAVDRPV